MSETETIEGGLFYYGYGSRDKTPMTKRQHTKPRYKKCSVSQWYFRLFFLGIQTEDPLKL